jgi:hypothetical protein
MTGNILTRSKPFKMIVKKVFQDMDFEGNGQVDKNELYMGLLMVHLKLAKCAGPAACYVSVVFFFFFFGLVTVYG